MKVKLIFGVIWIFFVLMADSASITHVWAATTLIDFTGFVGNGFAPVPSTGQLDSEIWQVTSFSDSDGSFGSTYDSGDFVRGSNDGLVATGGVYAFDGWRWGYHSGRSAYW